jgi:hypothetical protein
MKLAFGFTCPARESKAFCPEKPRLLFPGVKYSPNKAS